MSAPADDVGHVRVAIEEIALDAVGSFHADADRAWVREHLQQGCALCRQAAASVGRVFDGLLLAARPVQPAPSVRARVLAAIAADRRPAAPADAAGEVQVWNRWTASSTRFYTLRADETGWQPTAIDGIEARLLRVDEQRDEVTMLVRMAAGTAYPGHRHGGDEQCYVLAGDLQVEERQLRAGDYQFAPAGSIHGVQSTRGGCTLLLVSSRRDVILAG